MQFSLQVLHELIIRTVTIQKASIFVTIGISKYILFCGADIRVHAPGGAKGHNLN